MFICPFVGPLIWTIKGGGGGGGGEGYGFFSRKDIRIPNVAEKNIMILVEDKKII